MKITFDIDIDQLTEYFVEDMKRAYIDHCTVFKHETNSKKRRKALLHVIEYYSIPTEFAAWRDSLEFMK